jgi:hypothetical protein
MAELFIDSFDHYATADLLTKWTSTAVGVNATIAINSTGGRRGGGSLRITTGGAAGFFAQVKKTLAVAPTGAGFVHGMFVKRNVAPSASGDWLAAIVESGTLHVILKLNPDYTISVLRGDGTVLGTSSATGMADGIGAYVEWKGTINDTTGTYTVRINGTTTVLTGSSKDTQNGGTSSWNAIWVGILNSQSIGATTLDFDDMYLFDQSGGTYNDFFGDARVDVRAVTGAGATTTFTPSTGSNFQNVDDATPNGDTDSNSTATVGAIDTFVIQDAPVTGAGIGLVQVSLYAKKSDAGTCTIASVVRHSGVNYTAAAQAPGTGYSYLSTIYSKNPGTSAAWVEADFNAAEIGYSKVS